MAISIFSVFKRKIGKKMKVGDKEKSSTFAIPFGTRGTGEAEGSGKNRKRKFIEKTGRRQEKVPKKYERLFRPGDRTGDNRYTKKSLILAQDER